MDGLELYHRSHLQLLAFRGFRFALVASDGVSQRFIGSSSFPGASGRGGPQRSTGLRGTHHSALSPGRWAKQS